MKTRLATGMLPPGSPVLQSMLQVSRQEGWRALYAGVQARVIWSALYGGIGLTTFELSKKLLGVQLDKIDGPVVGSEAKRHIV